jgi:signal recognition particle GTPase
MKKLALLNILFGMVTGLWIPGFVPITGAQESPGQQPSTEQTNISDQQLKAFAKAYVELRKILQEYEAPLSSAQDSQEQQKLQQEAKSKIEETLEKEGLNVQAYERIFTMVNSNGELRAKALRLINEERKRS